VGDRPSIKELGVVTTTLDENQATLKYSVGGATASDTICGWSANHCKEGWGFGFFFSFLKKKIKIKENKKRVVFSRKFSLFPLENNYSSYFLEE
jgi:hypothetical protein